MVGSLYIMKAHGIKRQSSAIVPFQATLGGIQLLWLNNQTTVHTTIAERFFAVLVRAE